MKQNIIVLLFLGLIGTGCKKELLDTASNRTLLKTIMWTTTSSTDLGVIGIYEALRSRRNTGDAGGDMLFELYSMDRYASTGIKIGAIDILDGTANPSINLFLNAWKSLYEGISRANDAIYNIPRLSPNSDQDKRRYIAEAKFLRAYYYYRLNQVWNGVPIYLEPTHYEQFTKPRSTAKEVWEVILKDLTDAISESALPGRYKAGDVKYGRVCKGAAYALRGKVNLYLENWSNAIADFNEVSKAGFSLYTGAGKDSYAQLFKLANEQSPEMIFSMQNVDIPNLGWNVAWYVGTRNTQGGCWSYYAGNPTIVDMYENLDGSPFNWDDIIPGYNEMQPKEREVYFLRNDANATELQTAKERGALISLFDPKNNESRISKAYIGRDPRLAQNFILPYSGYSGKTTSTAIWRWPFRGGNDLKADAFGYYFYRKFVPTGVAEDYVRDRVPIDQPLIRYADILLNWAEALNEQSGPTQAGLDLINQVRSRAGVAKLQMTDATKPTFVSSKENFRDRIRKERKLEFPNEGVTYFDELRWGTWVADKFQNGEGGAQYPWGVNSSKFTFLGDYIKTWPIPTAVIQTSLGVVEKTPGWIY